MKINLPHPVAFPAAIAAVSALCLLPSGLPGQGSLTPPGAPAPTMKTLQQIEPRTPIASAPYNISTSGSYYLTTNLAVGAGTNGITITANDVTLDLGGFVLAGGGLNNGVYVLGDRTNIVVRNGIIRNWESCVEAYTARNSRFENLQVSGGTGYGLDVGDNSLVLACQAQTSFWGISVNEGCLIKSCVAQSNSAAGIYAYAGCTIVDCAANGNDQGIQAEEGCTIQACTIRGSGGNKGLLATGATVLGCTVEGSQSDGISIDRGTVKDCTVRNNTGDGIDAFVNCHVVGNTCLDNVGAGINCTSGGHAIEGNLVAGNGYGINGNSTIGNLIIRNRAKDNGTNYNIVAGNTSGPIVTSANIATNTNPHANYSY